MEAMVAVEGLGGWLDGGCGYNDGGGDNFLEIVMRGSGGGMYTGLGIGLEDVTRGTYALQGRLGSRLSSQLLRRILNGLS